MLQNNLRSLQNKFIWLSLLLLVTILYMVGIVSCRQKQTAKSDTYLLPTSLQEDLVLYYSFNSNEGREITDLSGKDNHGRVRSGTYISKGKIGRAMSFDGQGDYIDIGDDSSIQTEVFTLSAWIKTSDTEGVWQTILSFENQSYAVSILPNGHIHYGWQRVKRGGEGTSDVRTGQWVFVAVTRDTNNLASIYVDGELENSFVCDTSSKFLYGGKIGGDTIDKEYFKGSIDEVCMYNRALSAPGIKQLYNITVQMGKSKQSKSPDIPIQDIRIEPDPNEGQVKLSGIVRDEQGKPVSNVSVTFRPMSPKEFITNDKGEFEGIYFLKNEPLNIHLKYHPNVYILARHTERNLAAAEKIPVGQEHRLEVTLTDAVTLTGQVIDPNRNPITNARIVVVLCDDYWGAYIDRLQLPKQDSISIGNEGNFKVKALPYGCYYEIIAVAEGYGIEAVELSTWNVHKKGIDLGKIILHPTNLSVSGMVIDGNSAPVPNAIIELKGERQVDHEPIKTDKAGKFTIEKLCEGTITIYAYTEDLSLRGQKDVKAGEKNIWIAIEKLTGVCRTGPLPSSLMGKKLPEFNELSLDVDKKLIKDKMILICFWDVNWQQSRHCIRKLAYMYDELKKQDIVVISIYASEIDKKLIPDLIKKFNISFPVGTIDGEIEEVQHKWGFDPGALPWCILADRNHIVIKEGFGLQVLRELQSNLNVNQ